MTLMTLEISVTPDRRVKALGEVRLLAGPIEVQPGCTLCRLLEDLRGEGVVGLLMAWDSEENFEQFIRSKLFWKVLSLMEMSQGRPEIRFHSVSRTTGLESVVRIWGSATAPNLRNRAQRSAPAPRRN